MARIKGITIEIGGDTQKLNKALEDVNKKTRDIQSELRQVERLLKLDPKNTELLAQKQKLLAEAVENSREKLDRLKTAQEQVNEQFRKGEINEEQYRAFQREVVKAEQELSKFEKQLHETGMTAEQVGKKLQDAGQKMTDVGKNLTTKVTAPLVGLGALATKSAIDFESAFAGVRKTVDATEEEFGALEKGIRKMAKEIPAAATEIAGVAEAAGQLGIETENILNFTRTMIDLGEATNLSADQAATSLARLANITQMPQTEFDRLGSTIVALGNNLATTEAEIVEMGLRLAGAGAQVGMTEAQILGFAGALSSVGIAAEAGGSAFSRVMADMQLAVETGSERLNDFAAVAGMSADEFRRAFQEDAAGAIIAFIQGLGTAEERGMSAIKVLDDMGITEIRLRDALLRAAGAGDLFNESIKIGTQAWEENTALTTEAEQRYETTASQLEILRNKLVDAGIELGDKLTPILRDSVIPLVETFIGHISGLIDWFSSLDPKWQQVILIAIGFAAALGPLLLIIGNIITVVGTITGALPILGAAFTALTGPIGLVIAAIAALIAIIVLVIKYWDEIVAAFKAGWQWLKDVFAAWWETFSEFWIGIWETVKSALLAAWEWIKDLFLQYHPVGLVISHWDTIKEFFSGLWDRVKEIFSGAMQAIGNFITDKFNAVVNFLIGIRDKIIGVFQRVKDRVTEIWEGIVGSIKGAINSVISAINGMIGRINKIRVDIPDWVPEYGGKTIGFNIPKIPYLAAGGDILRAGAAIVGERGPEMVYLPQGAQVRPLGSTKDVNLNISFSGLPPSVDEEALKSYLVRIIKEPRVMRTIDEALYENRRSNLAPQGAF